MLDFYHQFAQVLERENPVLATVIASKGSVPREIGAKMLILNNGEILQTIGGGAGEAKVIREAIIVSATGRKRAIAIDLSGEEGICGGSMEIWLERWCGEQAIALIEKILTSLSAREAITLVTPFDEGSPYLLPSPPQPVPTNAFIETLEPQPTLLIIGAGHVGCQLAKIAHLIGFEVIVQDDRPEWANRENYPQVARILPETIDIALQHLGAFPSLYITLVTRGYQLDSQALEILLKLQPTPQYIGMIGSRKRVLEVFRSLEKTGISKSQLQSIRAPIGLDLGALTPQEIAVSIASELILTRRGGTGRPLSCL